MFFVERGNESFLAAVLMTGVLNIFSASGVLDDGKSSATNQTGGVVAWTSKRKPDFLWLWMPRPLLQVIIPVNSEPWGLAQPSSYLDCETHLEFCQGKGQSEACSTPRPSLTSFLLHFASNLDSVGQIGSPQFSESIKQSSQRKFWRSQQDLLRTFQCAPFNEKDGDFTNIDFYHATWSNYKTYVVGSQ